MSAPEESAAKDALLGRWTYRSWMSNPDLEAEFNDLEFGRGELLIEYACWGKFIGRLILGDDYELRLTGTLNPGDPPTFDLDGLGDASESNGVHYQYFGCLMPLWPHDPRKRPTIVGSVTRAAPKKGSKDRPGSASTFVALKQNPLPDPDDDAKSEDTASAGSSTSGQAGAGGTGGTGGTGGSTGAAGEGTASSAPSGGAGGASGSSSGATGASSGEGSAASAGSAGSGKASAPSSSPPPGAAGYESESEKRPRRRSRQPDA